MALSPDEQKWFEEQLRRENAPDEAEQEMVREHLDAQRALQQECRRLREQCPLLWSSLPEIFRPGNPAAPMPPVLAPTFGEAAAWRMGQDSVVQWLRHMAEAKEEPSEQP